MIPRADGSMKPLGTQVRGKSRRRPCKRLQRLDSNIQPNAWFIEFWWRYSGPTYVQSDVIIHEVMADPWPSYDNATWPGGEWVEIYNNGTSTIDLTGYWLQDLAGNMIQLDENHLVGASSDAETMLIYSQETRVIAVNATTNSGVLNNGQETFDSTSPTVASVMR